MYGQGYFKQSGINFKHIDWEKTQEITAKSSWLLKCLFYLVKVGHPVNYLINISIQYVNNIHAINNSTLKSLCPRFKDFNYLIIYSKNIYIKRNRKSCSFIYKMSRHSKLNLGGVGQWQMSNIMDIPFFTLQNNYNTNNFILNA